MALGPKSIIEISNDMVTAQNTQLNAIYQTGENMRNTILQENEIPRKLAEEERKRVDADIALIKAPYDLAAAPLQGETSLMEAQRQRILAEYGLAAAPDDGKLDVVNSENNRLEAERLRREKRLAEKNDIRQTVVANELDPYLAKKGFLGGSKEYSETTVPISYAFDVAEGVRKDPNMSAAAYEYLAKDLEIAARDTFEKISRSSTNVEQIEALEGDARRRALSGLGLSEYDFQIVTQLGRQKGFITTPAPPEKPPADTTVPMSVGVPAEAPVASGDPNAVTSAPSMTSTTETKVKQPTTGTSTTTEVTSTEAEPQKPPRQAAVTMIGGKLKILDSETGTDYSFGTTAIPETGIAMTSETAALITSANDVLIENPSGRSVNPDQGVLLYETLAVANPLLEKLSDYAPVELQKLFADPKVGESMMRLAMAKDSLQTQYKSKDVIADYDTFIQKVNGTQDQSTWSRLTTPTGKRAKNYVKDPAIYQTLRQMGISDTTLQQVLNDPNASERDLREVALKVELAKTNSAAFYKSLQGIGNTRPARGLMSRFTLNVGPKF